MPSSIFIAWQDQSTRSWHTIGRLDKVESGYELSFTEGVNQIGHFPEEFLSMRREDVYEFKELIALFRNRLPSRNRSDFGRMLGWLNLTGDEDEFSLLSRFGLIPGTDSFMLYPAPDIQNGQYSLEFFVHGIRHMHESAMHFCSRDIAGGDRLFPMVDVLNRVDTNAIALRNSGNLLLGYVPAFYATDLKRIFANPQTSAGASITVVRNNVEAPIQIRLLCRVDAPSVGNFSPLDTPAHRRVKAVPRHRSIEII